MQKERFKQLLLSATNAAKLFALKYILNNLPPENLYIVRLNMSCDSPTLTQFDMYPKDDERIIEFVNAADVVELLVRKEKVPVWIDISVSNVRAGKTVLTLLCAGRFSDETIELYYHQAGLGPFGVKSPNLPFDYGEGGKFWLPGT